MSRDPTDLAQILAQMESLVRRAYADGYRHGSNDSAERMMRAVQNNVEQQMPALAGGEHSGAGEGAVRMSPPKKPAAGRAYVYGSVIATFRQAIMASPDAGMTKDDLIEYCHRLNIDVTTNTYRDTMKRLVGGEEVVRKHGAYFPGRLLRTDLANADRPFAPRSEPTEMKTVDAVVEGDERGAPH